MEKRVKSYFMEWRRRPVVKVIENVIHSLEGNDVYKDYFGDYVVKRLITFLDDYYFYVGKTGEVNHDNYILIVSKEAAENFCRRNIG